MELITLLPLLSAGRNLLADYSGKDVVRKRQPLSAQRAVALGTVELLARLEKKSDPLIGIWKVRDWSYKSFPWHTGFLVSGSMAVFLYDSTVTLWKGALFLTFQRCQGQGRPPRGIDWWQTWRGNRIEMMFDVDIPRVSPDRFRGDAEQAYRKPRIPFKPAAELTDIRMSQGIMRGTFRNTNIKGVAKFTFHQRRKWKDLPVEDLLS